jgi:hypothetical protein
MGGPRSTNGEKRTAYRLDILKKNTETLIDASREVGLEINIEKTKYM